MKNETTRDSKPAGVSDDQRARSYWWEWLLWVPLVAFLAWMKLGGLVP